MSDDYDSTGWGFAERLALIVFLLGLLFVVLICVSKVGELSGMPESDVDELVGLTTVLSWIPFFLLCSATVDEVVALGLFEDVGVRTDVLVFVFYILGAGTIALSMLMNPTVSNLSESTIFVACALLIFVLKGSLPLLENTFGERFDFGGGSA